MSGERRRQDTAGRSHGSNTNQPVIGTSIHLPSLLAGGLRPDRALGVMMIYRRIDHIS